MPPQLQEPKGQTDCVLVSDSQFVWSQLPKVYLFACSNFSLFLFVIDRVFFFPKKMTTMHVHFFMVYNPITRAKEVVACGHLSAASSSVSPLCRMPSVVASVRNLSCKVLGSITGGTFALLWHFHCSLCCKLASSRSHWERLHDNCGRIADFFFFSPNSFQIVGRCCQSNKTRWAKQINTFSELGKWQILCSF